ncbi:lipase family protein [Actinokineospora bangkokensis]|uniref:Triacylglycerol lipase n=1 Tax=Actinokineospora bangkokensis TaxID=1193682 RepID=A0A1Q9LML9_9PSEU|nr:lipase family protein [Actinokineospora bangkokensis]OLR93261.1 triacylglycerol lipase [Actinokineospora bangkokensis]
MKRRQLRAALAAVLSLVLLGGVVAPAAHAADSFFSYSGPRPLGDLAPGTVLKSRTIDYHLFGLALPVKVVQVLYRTTDARGRAIANATSIVLPPQRPAKAKAVSYQSAYDSLSPADSPSRVIAGDQRFPGGVLVNVETALLVPLLAQGYTVLVPDTEGPTADFATGPVYGTTTLDSIRASATAPGTGLDATTRVGLLGYSGGAIGSNWAAALAPSYAPEVNQRLVGVAEGGLLVNPARNLDYVSGSTVWAGVLAAAVIGAARGYGVDIDPYLNDRGRAVFAKMADQSLANILLAYPGLTWRDLVKPEYADPTSVPVYVDLVNKLNLGQRPSPTVPLYIAQGAAGFLEGTSGLKPGIGAGDGVMVTGDVRTLARQYCAAGTRVQYKQFDLLSHVGGVAPWVLDSLPWLNDRFAGKQAPSTCGSIPAGNPLTPVGPAV